MLDNIPLTKRERALYVFDVPDKLAHEVGIASVGIVELTTEEELMATRRAGNDPIRLAYELARQALVQVNGKTVTLADGSADKAWESAHPKLRGMLMRAYNEVNQPTNTDVDSFLKSRQVLVTGG